jgi:hypothetical protein
MHMTLLITTNSLLDEVMWYDNCHPKTELDDCLEAQSSVVVC